MLTTIRSKASSIVSYVLIGLLCLSFALFGIQNYLGEASDVSVATVAGEDIKKSAFENQVNRVTNQFVQQYGRETAQLITSSNEFRNSVLDEMINNILITEMVNEQNYSASDADLAAYILSQPQFQNETGQFDESLYQRILSQNGLSVEGYEESLRANVAINQIEQANRFMNDYVPSVVEASILKTLNQQRDIDYFTIKFDTYEVEISDDEVRKYYEDNKQSFLSPYKIKLDYVVVNTNDIEQGIELSDDDILSHFENNKTRYVKPEERTVRHILISVTGDDNKEEALNKANDIKQRIAAGEEFAALATEFSDDPGSAAQGGDLGVVNLGVMVESFEQAMLSLDANVVSDPVETEFGFHLIEVTNITAERGQSFNDVKDQIKSELLEESRLIALEETQENMKNLSFENPDFLDPIAESLQVEIQTTDYLADNSQDGLFQYPEIKQVALSEEFVFDNLNSDAIVTENGIYIIRRNSEQEPAIQQLDMIKNDIVAIVENNKKSEALQQLSTDIIDQLQSNSSLSEVADTYNVELIKAPTKKSDAVSVFDQQLVQSTFAKAANQLPVIDKTFINNDLVVYQINSINVPESVDNVADEDQQRVSNLLLERQSRLSFSEFLQTLRMNSKVVINNEEINIY